MIINIKNIFRHNLYIDCILLYNCRMNQFKSSWEFTFSNWKYFLALGLPLIVIESLSAFLIIPLGEMTQPEDFVGFFESNGLII